MPSGFIPNGMVANHSIAGSLSAQYCGDPMNASIVPLEAASKHSNGCIIWPPWRTSIRNRPPLVSSTTFANLWAAPWSRSSAFVHAVDMRHWTFGCAMTLGASTMAAAVAVARAPPAVTINRRRSIVTLPSSSRDELLVGPLGDVIPRADQRLELREGRMDFPGHGRLLRFLFHDLGGDLLELPEHQRRELDNLDCALELRLETLERDGILQMEVGRAIRVHGRHSVVEHAPQVDGQSLVGLLVEAELLHSARLVPARVVVVARRLVQVQQHVVMRRGPFGSVDHAALERSVDVHSGGQHRRGTDPRVDFAAEVRNAHPKPLEVADRADLLPEPAAHLRGVRVRRARDEVERSVSFLLELETLSLVEPCRHPLGVHAEGDSGEPLDRGLLVRPPLRGPKVGLDLALSGRLEALERLHDLAAREDLDPEPPAAHLLDHFGQSLGRALQLVEHRRKGGGHAPLHLWLRDDVRGIDDRGGADRRQRAACRHQEPPPLRYHRALLIPPRAGGRRLRPRGPTDPPAPGTSRTTRAPCAPWASFPTLP